MLDAFDLVRPSNSTTKATATVTTEPRTLGLNESAKVRFPTNRPTSKAAQILSEHRIANGTREDGRW
jgi:hypothetical protein